MPLLKYVQSVQFTKDEIMTESVEILNYFVNKGPH
jgi:hypothetical protein